MTFFNLPSPRFSSQFYAAVPLYLALMAVACFPHPSAITMFFFFELWKNKYFTLAVNVDRLK